MKEKETDIGLDFDRECIVFGERKGGDVLMCGRYQA